MSCQSAYSSFDHGSQPCKLHLIHSSPCMLRKSSIISSSLSVVFPSSVIRTCEPSCSSVRNQCEAYYRSKDVEASSGWPIHPMSPSTQSLHAMSLGAHTSKADTIAGGSEDTAIIGSPQPTHVWSNWEIVRLNHPFNHGYLWVVSGPTGLPPLIDILQPEVLNPSAARGRSAHVAGKHPLMSNRLILCY